MPGIAVGKDHVGFKPVIIERFILAILADNAKPPQPFDAMGNTSALIFADFNMTALAAIGVVAFVAATVGGLGGTGISLMLIPLLVPLFGIKSVIPLLSVAMVLGNGSRVWAFWRNVDWRIAWRFYLPAIPGLVVGVTIYDMLPAHALYGLLGVLLIVMVPLRRYMDGRQWRLSGRGLSGVGAGYGVINGSMTGTGAILTGTLLGAGLNGGTLIGTKALIGLGQAVVKISMFVFYGLIDTKLALAGLMVGLCMIPGAFLARRLIEHLNIRRHTFFIEGIIVFGGVSMLWRFIQ